YAFFSSWAIAWMEFCRVSPLLSDAESCPASTGASITVTRSGIGVEWDAERTESNLKGTTTSGVGFPPRMTLDDILLSAAPAGTEADDSRFLQLLNCGDHFSLRLLHVANAYRTQRNHV